MNHISKIKTILNLKDLKKTFSALGLKNRIQSTRSLLNKTPDVNGMPRFLHIDVTNKCNLRCVMCGRTAHELKGGDELSFETFKAIIDQAEQMDIELVLLHSSGEPLMNSRIVDMIEYVSSKRLPSWMSTNATLLTEKKSKAILNSGLSGIVLSLDGATKETYEKIRNGANFEKTLSNIKKFIALRDQGKSKILTTVQLIKMPENEHEISTFEKMWDEYNDINILVKPLALWGKEASIHRQRDFVCDKLWYWMKVHCDGKVYPCGHDFKKVYCFGDAVKDGLENIWKGEEFKFFRKKMVYNWRSIEMCTNCGYGPPRERTAINNCGFCAIDLYTLTKIIFLYGYKKPKN